MIRPSSTGEAFAEILKKAGVHGKCIELQGMLTDMNAVHRSQGWNEVGKATGQYETIVQVPTNWNPELFLSGFDQRTEREARSQLRVRSQRLRLPLDTSRARKGGPGGRQLGNRSICGWRPTISSLRPW